MYPFRSVKVGVTALVMLIFLSAPRTPTYAGKEQRVKFGRGRTTAILKGRLPREAADYDAYLVGAKARQKLIVHLASSDRKAFLRVFSLDLGPAEDMITPEPKAKSPLRDWSGPMPVSGDYSIQVYPGGSGGAYTLEVTVR